MVSVIAIENHFARKRAAMQAEIQAQDSVAALVKQAQAGGAAAFSALYEHYYDSIFRYVSFRTGSVADAEDITAEVFVRMIESIHRFKWKGYPFSSWLFRIAHNLVVDFYRKKGRRKTVSLENAPPIMETVVFDADARMDIELTMGEVRRAMECLTDLQREAITLRFAAGLSVAETARAMGKKDNAVKALQHAGLKKLRRELTSMDRIDRIGAKELCVRGLR